LTNFNKDGIMNEESGIDTWYCNSNINVYNIYR
jgi:hypothetical protein